MLLVLNVERSVYCGWRGPAGGGNSSRLLWRATLPVLVSLPSAITTTRGEQLIPVCPDRTASPGSVGTIPWLFHPPSFSPFRQDEARIGMGHLKGESVTLPLLFLCHFC
jgi:hypothetical protein